jgi:hypothetical protein
MWVITQDFDFAFSPSQPLIAACFAGVTWLGTTFSKSPQWRWALPAGVLAEGVFFLVTNFAVWALVEGTPYPPTLGGLWLCYVAAVPFIGKSLVSTVIFTSVFFSPWVLSLAGIGVRQSRPSMVGSPRGMTTTATATPRVGSLIASATEWVAALGARGGDFILASGDAKTQANSGRVYSFCRFVDECCAACRENSGSAVSFDVNLDEGSTYSK